MRVCILDDERPALDNIKMVLSAFQDIEIMLATTDYAELLEKLPAAEPDVVFLDISLPEINGIELAERIDALYPSIKIVFVTAYNEYAVEAFQVNAADYIMKPITGTKMQRTLNKLFQYQVENTQLNSNFRIIGNQNGKFFIVSPEQGEYIVNENRELILVAGQQRYLLKHSIGYWENQLKPYDWIRCHQSFLVNINQIASFSPMFNSTYILKMKGNQDEIPVSRTYVQEFKRRLEM